MKVHPLRGRGFESHLAPHIALFQGLVSESEPFRKVHAPILGNGSNYSVPLSMDK